MTPRHNRKRLIIEAIVYGALMVFALTLVFLAATMYFS